MIHMADLDVIIPVYNEAESVNELVTRVDASLSKEEIERLKNEAASHQAEDQMRRELIEAKNHGESLAYLAEKSLKDAEGKIPEDVKKTITEKIEALQAILKEADERDAGYLPTNADAEKIKSAAEALGTEIQKIGQAMYNKDKGAEDSGPKQEENNAGGTS